MTVDTVVKIVEGEKCGLDMSSYEDLHSSSPMSVANVGGDGNSNGNGDCNGEGKDDYVFVNNSDVASSDDHVENHENGEVNLAELSVEVGDNVKAYGDVESDCLEGGVKVDEEGSKVENVANVVCEESGGGVEGGGLEEEKREIELGGEAVEVENGGSDSKTEGEVENGGRIPEVHEVCDLEPTVDGAKEASVPEPVVDQVQESSDREPVVDQVNESSDRESVIDEQGSNDLDPIVDEAKEVELDVETGANGSVSIDGIASRSLDVDDNIKISVSDSRDSAEVESEDNSALNSAPDASEPSEVDAQIDTAVVGVPEGELEVEQPIVSPLENGIEIPGAKAERTEVQEEKPELTESNGDVHGVEVPVTELESADSLTLELKPLETDVSEQAEKGLAEAQALDGDFKASLPLDAEDNGLALDDATCEQQSSDSQLQNLPSVDVENVKEDLVEAEAKTDVQGDAESVAVGGSQAYANSEAAVSELDQGEQGEITDQAASGSAAKPEETPDLESLPHQSEEPQNQVNLEFADTVAENPTSITVGESDESKIESTSGVEENSGAPTADIYQQLDVIDKSVAEDELERVDVDREPEVVAEVRGREVKPVAERARWSDMVDKEISSGEFSSEKILTNEDTTNLLNLQSSDDTAMDANENDHSGSHNSDGVSENKDVCAAEKSRGDAGSKDQHLDNTVLTGPSDTDINERVVVNDLSAVADKSPNGSVEDTCSQTKLENGNGPVPCPVHDSKLETTTVNSKVDVAIKENNFADGTSRPKISFGSFDCEPSLAQNDINLRSNVLSKSTAPSTNSFRYKRHAANGVPLISQANGVHTSKLNHDTASAQVARLEQGNELSAAVMEGSEADSLDGQNFNPDLVRRPFYWLIKIPRCDNRKLKEQLRQVEIELAEKTKIRNAFQAEFYKQQAHCRELSFNYEAARRESADAFNFVRAKKKEVDAAHSLLNLAKNGTTTEDIDNQIRNREHKLQHETLLLKEEKELIREITRLTQERQKISSNPQKQQELQQALNQKTVTEEKLKVLKKELDALRDKLSKAEEHVRAAKKKLDDEDALLIDMNHELNTKKDIRQEAYIHSKILQRQLNEKEAPHFRARDDIRVAHNYAAAGKKETLERHCLNQVEKVMELWNKNDEFRKEYIQGIRSNMLRKLGTLDGTRLGIDEVPPPLGDVSDNRVSASPKVKSSTAVIVEREVPLEAKPTEEKLLKKVEQKKPTPTAKKSESTSKNSLAKASAIVEIEEDTEEPAALTKEEEELAMKAEQLRKEEEAARLREQRRLEEKAKAEEALERKRRNAMKAQARAELKARREAEQKEKEREKRAKKKEKKKGLVPEITEKEPALASESSSESIKEPDVTEKPAKMTKRPQKVSLHTKQIKTTKPLPPALRNKGKRGLLRYWPYPCFVLLALALFYLGSFERIQTIKQHISGLLHW